MRTAYDELQSIVPQSSPFLVSTTMSDVDRLRRRVIQNSRFVSLHHFLFSLPDDLLRQFQSRDRLDILLQPRDRPAFPGISQLSQNTAFLLSFLADHPAIFAKAAVSAAKTPEFEFIAGEVIPAFFAFFSSAEQLDLAQQFYQEVSNLANPVLSVQILSPFFNSIGTFRFLEHALDKFVRTFVLDCVCTAESARDAMVETHGATLVNCFIEALPLIPRQHIELLRHLRTLKWPKAALTDLVLCRFLWPSTITWLKSSPHQNKTSLIEELIVRIAEQKELIAKLWKAIHRARSVYEVPSLFYAFEQCHLLYYLCVNDIAVFAKLLDEQGLLPKSITYDEFAVLDRKQQFNWFWCQMFPRLTSHPSREAGNVISRNAINVNDFSEDPDYRELKGPLDRLIRLSAAFESFLEQRRDGTRLSRSIATAAKSGGC
jgi:hypothetical protein